MNTYELLSSVLELKYIPFLSKMNTHMKMASSLPLQIFPLPLPPPPVPGCAGLITAALQATHPQGGVVGVLVPPVQLLDGQDVVPVQLHVGDVTLGELVSPR